MKKVLIFLLLFPSLAYSQVQDLANLSRGNLVFSDNIFDNNTQLFGYFFIYELDKIDNATIKYEYVLLDKNLNPVFNMEHVAKTHKRVKRFFVDTEYMGDKMSLTSKYSIKKGMTEIIMFSSTQLIDLKTKKVLEEIYLKDNKLAAVPDNFDEVFEAHRKYRSVNKGQVFGISYEDFTGYFAVDGLKSIAMFNENKDSLWHYQYNEPQDKIVVNLNRGKRFVLELLKDNYVVGLEMNIDTRKKHYYKKIKAFGLNDATKPFDYTLQDGNSAHNLLLWKMNKLGDYFHCFGSYSVNNKKRMTYLTNRLGYYRLILDVNGQETDKKYFNWDELSDEMKIDKYGRLKNGYYLRSKELFVFKDGSSAILFEKYKPKRYSKTTDMVLVQFDKDFNYQKVHTIKKAKGQGLFHSDFLYSQYVKDKTGAVFFFRNKVKNPETKKEEWILGINTLIDGTYGYEEIPMEAEDFEISIMPAKEGYILIHEADKSDKKGKNEIRLERLNY